MSLKLDNMRTKTATVDVGEELDAPDFMGLHVTYKPFASTNAESRQVAQYAEKDKYVALVDYGIESALAQIVEWDLEENGVTVPLTKEALAELPDGILSTIGAAIRLHKLPNSLKKDMR